MSAPAETAYEAHDWQGVLDALGTDDDLSGDALVLKAMRSTGWASTTSRWRH